MTTALRRRLVAGLGCLFGLFLPGATVTADDALRMPLAPQSLLLDVQLNAGRIVAVGERGHILLSDDLGDNWRQVTVPTRQMLTAVHFPGPDRGWAVGHDGLILASVDGGDSWVLQRDGLQEQRHYNERRLRKLREQVQVLKRALLAAPDERARRSSQDRIETLEMDVEDLEYVLGQPVFAPPLLDVYFLDELRGVAVGAFGTLLLTSDGGLSWAQAGDRLDNPDGMHLNAVTGDAGDALWIAAEGGLLFRSEDAGVSWESLASPYPASWFGISRSSHSGVLLVFGLRGNVFRSTDSGDSWQPAATDSRRSLSGGTFLGDDHAVLVGSVGEILMSSDGGRSFVSRPMPRRVGLAAVAPVRDRLVLVGQGGFHRVPGFGELR